ncbi:MAG: ribosome silencing factor [Bacteroidales bacterium]|nr:ribosome silencing factor [Bacteroidales bacterium]
MKTKELTHIIIDILEEKKGEDIVLLDISEVADFADYFIICSGTSSRMVSSLADSVTNVMRKQHKLKMKVEGNPSGGWQVLDYGDVIVHVFSPEQREYYQLENLWSAGKTLLRLH